MSLFKETQTFWIKLRGSGKRGPCFKECFCKARNWRFNQTLPAALVNYMNRCLALNRKNKQQDRLWIGAKIWGRDKRWQEMVWRERERGRGNGLRMAEGDVNKMVNCIGVLCGYWIERERERGGGAGWMGILLETAQTDRQNYIDNTMGVGTGGGGLGECWIGRQTGPTTTKGVTKAAGLMHPPPSPTLSNIAVSSMSALSSSWFPPISASVLCLCCFDTT